MQGVTWSMRRTSSSLYFKHCHPRRLTPYSHRSWQPLPRQQPPWCWRRILTQEKVFVLVVVGHVLFLLFPQLGRKSKHKSAPTGWSPTPPPGDSGSPPAGAEAYCRGRQLAGAIEGSHRSSLTCSSWCMKPKLLGLHGHGSVAHTHTRHEHSRAWGSSELPMFIQTHPCQVSRASPSPSCLHLVLF